MPVTLPRGSRALRVALIASSRHPIAQPFAGGLEAHVWQLARALTARGHHVTLFAAPGNPGIAETGAVLVTLDVDDHGSVVEFCRDNTIGLVVVGPEAPLVAGIADKLRAAGIAVFGPSMAGSMRREKMCWCITRVTTPKLRAIRSTIPTAIRA